MSRRFRPSWLRLVTGLTALGALLVPGLLLSAELPPPFVLKWGSYGTSLGQFRSPTGVAADPGGNVWVVQVDTPCRVTKFTPAGSVIGAFGSCGSGNGQFSSPHDLSIDGSGNIYVADALNDRIQKFSSTGAFVKSWGGFGTANGQFNLPSSVVVDAGGNVYVTDRENQRVQKFTSNGAFVTKWGSPGSGNGQFNDPEGIAVDPAGNVYVADKNHRVQKFSSSGTYLARVGTQGAGNGQFYLPGDITFDGNGAMYVVDTGNHRIQKFSSSLTFVLQWGSFGLGNGQFISPWGINIDRSGYVYVADTGNHRIQKFGPVSGSPVAVPNTPTGTNVTVQLEPDTDITFDRVVFAGTTSLSLTGTGPAPPSGFLLVPAGKYYSVTTTAAYSGTMDVCITYATSSVRKSEAALRMFYYDTSLPTPYWRDVTTLLKTSTNLICGTTQSPGIFIVAEPSSATGIEDELPGVARLLPAFPNPFRSRTRITFELPSAAPVSVRIHDVTGRLVRTLVDGPVPAGETQLSWDGRDEGGVRLPGGMYFIRVVSEELEATQKLLLLE